MRFTPAHTSSYEKIWMQFFLARNEWQEVDWATGGHSTQMRGFPVFYILDQALLDGYDTIAQGGGSGRLAGKKFMRLAQTYAGLGQSVHCTSQGTPPGTYYPWPAAGICDDNLLTGEEQALGRWINCLVFGHCENIPVSNATAASAGLIYVTGNTGICGIVDPTAILDDVKLQGAVLIDVASAGPAVLDLSGANNTQTTWVTTPSLNTSLLTVGTSSKVPQESQVIGYKYKEAITSDPTSAGVYSRTRGFINTLAINTGRI